MQSKTVMLQAITFRMRRVVSAVLLHRLGNMIAPGLGDERLIAIAGHGLDPLRNKFKAFSVD